MSVRHLFLRNQFVPHRDHNQNNKGNERLPYAKTQNDLSSFLDYDTFLDLSRSYSQNYVHENRTCSSPMSAFNTEKSYLSYKDFLSHIMDCDMCGQCRDISDFHECKEARNLLYPYGNTFDYARINNLQCKPRRDIFREPEGCKRINTCCEKKSCMVSSKWCNSDRCRKSEGCCDSVKPINCHKTSIYPSQHNFVFNRNQYCSYRDQDQEKRMNSYSKYPQISKRLTYVDKQCFCIENQRCNLCETAHPLHCKRR